MKNDFMAMLKNKYNLSPEVIKSFEKLEKKFNTGLLKEYDEYMSFMIPLLFNMEKLNIVYKNQVRNFINKTFGNNPAMNNFEELYVEGIEEKTRKKMRKDLDKMTIEEIKNSLDKD